MSIIADFAVPGGPTITMCSPAIAEIVISRMISCLSRNCAPIWRARSWNDAERRATSTAKLRGVVGGATIRARSHYPKTLQTPTRGEKLIRAVCPDPWQDATCDPMCTHRHVVEIECVHQARRVHCSGAHFTGKKVNPMHHRFLLGLLVAGCTATVSAPPPANPQPPPPPPPAGGAVTVVVTPTAQKHPAYLHALTDLRHARAFLAKPAGAQVKWDENRAIRELD